MLTISNPACLQMDAVVVCSSGCKNQGPPGQDFLLSIVSQILNLSTDYCGVTDGTFAQPIRKILDQLFDSI